MILLVLFILIAIVAELARRSGLTRTIIARTLTDRTGIQTDVEYARVGLTGHTSIRGVHLRLPMATDPVLSIDNIDVTHNSLFGIITSLQLRIDNVTVEHPELRIEQEPDGRLNLEHLATRLALLGGAGSESGPSAPPSIPPFQINNGTALLRFNDIEHTVPFQATGTPDRGALLVGFVSEGLLTIDATAAIGADWQHHAAIAVHATPEHAAPVFAMLGVEPQEFGLDADWRGRAQNGGLAGTLDLDAITIGTARIDGSIHAITDGTKHVIKPSLLQVNTGGTELSLAAGRVTVRGSTISIARLQIRQDDLAGEANGTIDLDAASGTVTLDVLGATAGYDTRQRLVASAKAVADRLDVHCELSGRATDQGDTSVIDTVLVADLEFSAPTEFRGTVRADRLEVEQEGVPRDLTGLLVLAESDGSTLTLSADTVPHAVRGTAAASLEYATGAWSALLDLHNAQLHPTDPPATVKLIARGESAQVKAWEIDGQIDRHTFSGDGSFDADGEQPLVGAFAIATRLGEPNTPDRVLAGIVSATVQVRGCLNPLGVTATGMLDATQTLLEGSAICAEPIKGVATIDERGVDFVADPFELFEGDCELEITRGTNGHVDVTITADQISVPTLAALLEDAPPLDGRLTGTLTARGVTGPAMEITAAGDLRIDDLAVPTINADTAACTINIRDGVATLSNIELRQHTPTMTGSIEYPLNGTDPATVDLHANGLRIESGALIAGIEGAVTGTIDLDDRDAVASIDATIRPTWQDTELGSLRLLGTIQDRVVSLREFSSRFAGGTIEGTTTIPIDDWTKSTAALTLDEIRPSALADLFPHLDQVNGRLSGTLRAGPDTTAPLDAPLRVGLGIVATEGAYREIDVRTLDIEAYVGPRRSLLRRADATLLGGSIRLHGTTNIHDEDRYIQLAGEVEDIDLTRFLNSISSEPAPVRGRLTATFGAAGYASPPSRLVGEARVGIRQADLLGLPVVSQVFSLMRGGAGGPSDGRGDAVVRIEGDDLTIPRFTYFNRGTDVRGTLEIDDLLSDKPSRIRGIAVGTARPLADAKALLTKQLDGVINAVQSGGVAVEITGPLEAPQTRVIPFERVLNTLKRSVGIGS